MSVTGDRARVALVTGAAGGGIGEAVATRMAADGFVSIVTDKHRGRAHEVAAGIATAHPGAAAFAFELDCGDRAQIDDVVAQVVARFGGIDVLVNNAAINKTGTIFDYDPMDWDDTLAVNLTGPWQLCRRAMPVMRDNGGGVIVNVSSLAAELGGSGIEGAYAVSKGGLNVLTRACAHDGAPYGIRAVTVSLGLVTGTRYVTKNPEILDYPFTRPLLGEHPSATEVADLISYLVSDRARHITGEIVNLSSGLYLRP